jgi:DNA-binding GntR family transcriptional regulator
MKIVKNNVRELAVQKLRSAIISGQLQPGQRLVEKDLCHLTGVSRTSIREALRILEGERLIRAPANKGPSVAVLTSEEASQIYQVRAVLESLAVRAAAIHATEEEIGKLDDVVDRFARAAAAKDLMSLVKLAAEYYDILMTASRNEIVADILKSLHARVSFLRATSMSTPGRLPQSIAEMRAIVKAIEKKDPDAAAKASERHIARGSRAAIAGLATLTKQAANGQPHGKARSNVRLRISHR